MDTFEYRNGRLHCEAVDLTQIADQFGSPTYVYSRAAITHNYQAYAQALQSHSGQSKVCYAVKANSNLAVLNVLARLGAGFDIVSGGELERVLQAGGSADNVVFSGVAKQAAEIRRALEVGIHCFNVESEAELARINQVAGECGRQAPVSFRINPDVDAGTHPYISTGLKENKFGIAIDQAVAIYQRAAQLPHIRLIGVDCHIGSQLTSLAPFMDALDRLLALIDQLAEQGIVLQHLDLGGGLGVCYHNEQPPEAGDYMAQVLAKLAERKLDLIVEPGRSIVANAGVMLTRVEFLKDNGTKHFAIVDGGMNDLIRPSLYSAYQAIIPVTQATAEVASHTYDIVGPVCETGDFLGKERNLALQAGDLLAVCGAGAYGFVMSSNYNTRPRPAEVMVDDTQIHQVRRRETLQDMLQGEQTLPEDH